MCIGLLRLGLEKTASEPDRENSGLVSPVPFPEELEQSTLSHSHPVLVHVLICSRAIWKSRDSDLQTIYYTHCSDAGKLR